jgi:hypothetical protein
MLTVKEITFVKCFESLISKKYNELKKNFLPNIYLCIFLDLLGLSSYLLPAIGETIDIIWAPISAVVFYFLFGKKKFGLLGGVFSFLEEISPGFDFIPTFTIAWFIRKREMKASVPSRTR